MTRHVWTQDDDRLLSDAVAACSGAEADLRWIAVVRALRPHFEVSPDGARSRWKKIQSGNAKHRETSRSGEDSAGRRLWDDGDDRLLLDAVDATACLDGRVSRWAAVCGRLAPAIIVGPDSAMRRYQRILEAREKAKAAAERTIVVSEQDAVAVPDDGPTQLDRIEALLLELVGIWR